MRSERALARGRWSRRLRRRHRRTWDDRGSTVETVILFPMLMLLLMMVVQAAVFFHARGVATAGARAGLDAARVEEGSVAMGDDAAREFIAQTGQAFMLSWVAVSRDPVAERATVTVEGEVMSVFPLFSPTITITVDAPLEQVS